MTDNFRSTKRQFTLRIAAIACLASCCLVAFDLWDNRDWAPMAPLRTIAEVPEEGRSEFWSSDGGTKAAVMQLFRPVGAKAVVTTDVPTGSASANWRLIEDTDYYVYTF